MAGETYNVFGVQEDCKQSLGQENNNCRPGYIDDRCESCDFGYFPIKGKSGEVIEESNLGVKCQGESLITFELVGVDMKIISY